MQIRVKAINVIVDRAARLVWITQRTSRADKKDNEETIYYKRVVMLVISG